MLAYVTGVLAKSNPTIVVPNRSVVLAFSAARQTGDFAQFQRLGDEVLFVGSVFPESIASHREVTESVGSLSYYACYRIMRRQWLVYEELADQLPVVVRAVKLKLNLQIRHRNLGDARVF